MLVIDFSIIIKQSNKNDFINYLIIRLRYYIVVQMMSNITLSLFARVETINSQIRSTKG